MVITREPEWDDHSRGRALRLGEYEADNGICDCGCGQPLHIARDPDQAFTVDEFTCHAGRALEKTREERREQEERRKEAGQPPSPSYGRHLYVRPHDPDRDGPVPDKDGPVSPRKRRRGGRDVGQVSPGPPSG